MRIGVRGKLGFRVATVVVAGLLISTEGEAVMLEWMGKKKVVNHHNEVPFHVLERKWEFGGGPRSVAAAPTGTALDELADGVQITPVKDTAESAGAPSVLELADNAEKQGEAYDANSKNYTVEKL